MRLSLAWLTLFILMTKLCLPNRSPGQPGFDAGPGDTSRKLYAFDVNKDPVLKGLKTIDYFDISNQVVYLIATDRLLQLDLATGQWTVNGPATAFLKKMAGENKVAGKIIVRNGQYYIVVLNEVFKLSAAGGAGAATAAATKIAQTYRFITDFHVGEDGDILVATQDSIELFNSAGQLTQVRPFPLSDDAAYRSATVGLGYTSLAADSVLEFISPSPGKIEVREYAPIALPEGKNESYLSLIAGKYFISFPYRRRNVLYVSEKGSASNTLYKKIILKGAGFVPDKAQLDFEEGEPGLRVAEDGGRYYILNLLHGKLTILTFDL